MHTETGYGLNILRETIMGRDLFDYAFKVYANRWKFKHPTRKIFQNYGRRFCSRFGLVLRGWFYSTDFVDIGIKMNNIIFLTPTVALKMQK
jgi:hypothetical protein